MGHAPLLQTLSLRGYASCVFLTCRADNIENSDVRSSVHRFCQNLQYFRIPGGVVSFGVLFVVPEADRHDFPGIGEKVMAPRC